MDLNWKEIAMWAAPIGAMLLAGKAIRRLFLLPFEYLARKTSTPVDDVIVAEASKDLGIEKPTLGGDTDNAAK